MVGRAREVLPQSPTLSRGHLRLVGGDVSLVTCRSLIPPVSLIGNTSAMFRGTAKIFTELLQHPSGNNGCHTRGTTSPALPARWTVEETAPCIIVRDHNGQALAFVYCEDEPGRRSTGKLLTGDEAYRRQHRQAAGATASEGVKLLALRSSLEH